jgi:neutral ceramidase
MVHIRCAGRATTWEKIMKRHSWALACAVICTGAVGLPMPGQAAALTAGAGRATIDLPAELLPIDRFTTVLDPLEVRVLVLGEGDHRAAVAVLDQTSLFADNVTRIQSIVAKAARISPDAVMVVASHTFSAPHMFGAPPPGAAAGDPAELARAGRYAANAMAAVERAAADAAKGEGPATVSFGTVASQVNVNRNVETAEGWWLGADETGPSDKTLSVLRFTGIGGQPIAALVNYPVQSSIMDQTGAPGGGKGVSADLAGNTVRRVEAKLGGVALFTTGAAGDQIPAYTARHNSYGADGRPSTVDLGNGGYPLVALQGERLGDAALKAVKAAVPVKGVALARGDGVVSLPTQQRPRDLAQLHPSRTYRYVVNGKSDAPFTVLAIGDVALVGVQVELNAATGAWIRAHSPYAHTVVATMVNGAAKYLPDASGYKAITYQAMNSSYAPGSAEVLAGAIIAELRRMATPKARK